MNKSILILFLFLFSCAAPQTYKAKVPETHVVIPNAVDKPQETYGRITVKTIELNQDENVKHFTDYGAAKQYFKSLVKNPKPSADWLGNPTESLRVVMFDQGYLLIQSDAPVGGINEEKLNAAIFKSTDGWYYRSDKLLFDKENGPFMDKFEAWAHALELFGK